MIHAWYILLQNTLIIIWFKLVQLYDILWYCFILHNFYHLLSYWIIWFLFVFVLFFTFSSYLILYWHWLIFFAYLLRSSYLTFEKASFKYSLFKATWNTKLVIETSQMRHKRYRYAMIDEIRHRFFVFILFISQPSQTTRDSVNQASRTEVKSPRPLHPCTSQPHV